MPINWFGDSVNYPGLVELLQETCQSMYPEGTFYALAEQAATGDQLALMQYEDALASIIDACYVREPAVFGNILWIDTDLGTPMWVRPGERWLPQSERTAEDDKPQWKHTVIANRNAMVATGLSISERSLINFSNEQLEALRES